MLTVAIDQINKFTDIDVSYVQRKEGRTITHIEFSFDLKVDLNSNSNEIVLEPSYLLTSKQSVFFANKLCDLTLYPKFGAKYANVGESIDDFRERIARELQEQKNVQKYYQYLLCTRQKKITH